MGQVGSLTIVDGHHPHSVAMAMAIAIGGEHEHEHAAHQRHREQVGDQRLRVQRRKHSLDLRNAAQTPTNPRP